MGSRTQHRLLYALLVIDLILIRRFNHLLRHHLCEQYR
jgi:hypothetical protein